MRCKCSENAYENQVYVAQIVRKNIIAISNIFWRLAFNMARECWCSMPIASWWFLDLTFILLGYLVMLFCSLFFFQHGQRMVVFKPCFFMVTFQDFRELWRWITYFLLIFRPKFLFDSSLAWNSAPESSVNKRGVRGGIWKCNSAQNFLFFIWKWSCLILACFSYLSFYG